MNKLTDVTCSPGPEDNLDMIKLSLHSEDITGERDQKTVLLQKSQVDTMLKELKDAYKKMEELENIE